MNGNFGRHGELWGAPAIVGFVHEGSSMRAATAPMTIRVHEPPPLGDVSLAPRELTGLSQAELARSLATYLTASAPDSEAQPFAARPHGFPRAPLAARMAAIMARI